MEFIKSDVKFKVYGKKIEFSIIHNLPETFGMSFNDALNSWVYRTKIFTAKSLVDYINSKNTGYTAMTEKKYNKICNTQ